jgi:hypothetical protein
VKRARSEVFLDCSKDGKLDLSLFRMDSNLSPPPDEGNHGGSDSELPVAESGRMVEGERDEDENNSGAGGGTPGSIEDKQKKKKPKRGGRPKADVWELYTTYGERNERTRRFLVTCNACGAIIDGRVEGMERHIGYDCQRIPEPEKLKWQERVVEKVKLIKEEAMNYATAAAAAGVGAGALVLKGSSVKRPKKIKRGEGGCSLDRHTIYILLDLFCTFVGRRRCSSAVSVSGSHGFFLAAVGFRLELQGSANAGSRDSP